MIRNTPLGVYISHLRNGLRMGWALDWLLSYGHWTGSALEILFGMNSISNVASVSRGVRGHLYERIRYSRTPARDDRIYYISIYKDKSNLLVDMEQVS